MNDNYEELLGDKEWRISHLYKIVDKDKNKVVFKKNEAQEHFDKHKHSKNIILKSRQLGFTTYEAVDSLDDTLFTPNYSDLFIAHTKEDAIELFDKKVDFTWKNFDEELKKLWKVDSSTANKLKFDFGDNTFSQMIVANSGRSGTFNRIHISEFAKLCAKYPSRAEEIISGTIPAATATARIDVESTAEGMGGLFYGMFWNAWNRKTEPLPIEFKAHFYNWQWDKTDIARLDRIIPVEEMEESKKFAEYQQQHNLTDIEITYYYTKWLSVEKDWEKLHQEFPTTPEEAFVASGNTFFNKERIMFLLTKAPEQIEVEKNKIPEVLLPYYVDGSLKIYSLPNEESSYVIGADVAEGKDKDSSDCSLIDNKTLKTCVDFNSNKIRPDDYAKVLNALGRWYNNAYLGVESNSGLWVLTELFEKLCYPNLYFREATDDITHTMKKQLGFATTGASRKPMLDNLLVQVNLLEGWSKDFLQQALVFIRNDNGRPEAMEGKHDDKIISTGIAYFIRENAPIHFIKTKEVPVTNLEITRARLQRLYGNKTEGDISQDKFI